ncbi:hypothetical protein CBS133816_10781 [Aspergillus niger]|nr:hypothetical protein CBS133816_10781 [Aspergillus niger]KAI2906991.1 hypothetical protein CBS147371_10890 [Aspergillus niger]
MAHTLDDYTIAWICALPLEAAAARAMLDKTHILPERASDPNAYDFGELNGHHIVIAYLPNGIYGTVSAATVVSRMRLTFPRLQFGLMVGIGGGVPSKSHDIRLGDVVVSTPGGRHGGVIQYDYGKAVQGGQFEPTGMLNQPPQALLTHISQIRAKQMTTGDDVLSFVISEALKRNPGIKERFSRPVQDLDLFFCSSYHHDDKESDCGKCDRNQLVERQPPERKTPYIHYGLIASGDQVMKDSETRDRLADQHPILCFEMEAAGLMNELPTLVVRGICDYCDSHKQKQWQGYAALTAAAYAKLLISDMPVSHIYSRSLETRKEQHWVVPLLRNKNFVGRLDEIKKLEDQIMMQDGYRRMAITGLGGIGKTQVALEVAYRIRQKDKERSVFWIPCTSRALIEATFLKIAVTVGISDIKPAEIKEQLKGYFSCQRAGRWLLIFDNADDTDMWLADSGADPALDGFLPQSEHGNILFTSRNRKLALKLAPFSIVSIPNEDTSTAFQMMQKLLVQEDLSRNLHTAANLASTYQNQGRWTEAEKLEVQPAWHQHTMNRAGGLKLRSWKSKY